MKRVGKTMHSRKEKLKRIIKCTERKAMKFVFQFELDLDHLCWLVKFSCYLTQNLISHSIFVTLLTKHICKNTKCINWIWFLSGNYNLNNFTCVHDQLVFISYHLENLKKNHSHYFLVDNVIKCNKKKRNPPQKKNKSKNKNKKKQNKQKKLIL